MVKSCSRKVFWYHSLFVDLSLGKTMSEPSPLAEKQEWCQDASLLDDVFFLQKWLLWCPGAIQGSLLSSKWLMMGANPFTPAAIPIPNPNHLQEMVLMLAGLSFRECGMSGPKHILVEIRHLMILHHIHNSLFTTVVDKIQTYTATG